MNLTTHCLCQADSWLHSYVGQVQSQPSYSPVRSSEEQKMSLRHTVYIILAANLSKY